MQIRRHLAVVLTVLVAVALVAVTHGSASARPTSSTGRVVKTATTTTTTTTATTSPSATTTVSLPGRAFGVAAPGLPWDTRVLQQVAAQTGRMPNLAMWYVAWSDGGDFPAQAAAQVAALGATPEVTWEPWNPAYGVDQPAYSLDRIAAGAFDAYVTKWAKQLKAYGRPVVLRFAHEMNGNWYPWAEGVNGNGAGDYVAAWKRVRGLFTKQGVTNVMWKWSPNVPFPGTPALKGLYPGDGLVEHVALDGYNWSTLLPGTQWTGFADIFFAGYQEIRSFTAKPFYVGEVGSTEVGGDKASWVYGMFATLAEVPDWRGFTWFEFDKEADWRIASSGTSRSAFEDALRTYR